MPKMLFALFCLVIGWSGAYAEEHAPSSAPERPRVGGNGTPEEYTKVIETTEESLARAYYNRANAYKRAEDHPRAIADFNRALRYKPDYAKAYNNRGLIYLASGFSARALADFEQALKLDEGNVNALDNRGIANFLEGNHVQAVRDLESAMKPDTADAYKAIWLFLAQQRAGGNAHASLKERAEKLDLKEWPGPIVELFLGDRTDRSVLAANEKVQDESERLRRRCETAYYLGEHLLGQGETEKGSRLLQDALNTGLKTRIEYAGARAQLARLTEAQSSSPIRDIPKKPYIATVNLNLREGPGKDHAKVGSIPRNSQVLVNGQGAGWYRVQLAEGQQGYAASRYLRPVN